MKLGDGWLMVSGWTTDGRQLLVQRWDRHHSDIVRMPVVGGDAVPLLASSANEVNARLSPDGSLLAFVSNESGENQVYVCTFDGVTGALGTRRRVTDRPGGSGLFWAHEGHTLHFINELDHLVAARITTEPEIAVAGIETVLDIDTLRAADDDLVGLPDGRFGFIRKGDQETEAEHLNVVLNWFDELNAKVSAR